MAICLLPIAKAQIKLPSLSQQSPIWFIKPKQVGYNLSTSIYFRPTVGADRVKVQFLDAGKLALAWLTPDAVVDKPIGPGNSVPSHLHLAILDARTGQRTVSHEWPCSARGVNLAYTASGNWLLSSDKTITLYSSSFDKVRDLQNIGTESFHTFVSPSGRTFLSHVSDSHGRWSGQLHDSETFEVLDSWNDARVERAHLTYSDHFILALIYQNPPKFYLRKVGGDWNPYSIPVPDNRLPGQMGYGFVNDDTIAGFAGPKMTLETVEGSELFNATLPEDGLYLPSWSVAATSTQGERFAVILDRSRGLRNANLDLYPLQSEDRVVVYSISKRSAIYNVKVKGISPWPYQTHAPWNVIALSPDGQLLGIVSDEGVGVYLLPPTGEEKQKSLVPD